MAGDHVDWVVVGDHSQQRGQRSCGVQGDAIALDDDVLHAVERLEHGRRDGCPEAQLDRLRRLGPQPLDGVG